jgi:prevent-host-death family protein
LAGSVGYRRRGIRRIGMKTAALSDVKNDLSRYLRVAEKEEVVITRHGKPAGVLRGFASEEEWFEYRLLNDPEFLKRVEKARRDILAGKGVELEALRKQAEQETQAGR